jgi:putative NADPH-quinone reductase
LCHALAEEYARGAHDAGHETRSIDVARLEFPLLRSAAEWQAAPCAAIDDAQRTIAWAEHLVIVFPLWMGDMPALLKGFFEQALRPGFALGRSSARRLPQKMLTGRSARLIVTMGMPALFYKVYYRGHSLASLRRNLLGTCGIKPVRTSVVGLADSQKRGYREVWLARAAMLGREAV